MPGSGSWDDHFLEIAKTVAKRGTCDRCQVGAVIVRDRMILSTGYNGAPRKADECYRVGHLLKRVGDKDSCVRTVHAEQNAIAQAARAGTAIEGATLYSTVAPCYDCAKLIINAGIVRVIADQFYVSRLTQETAELFAFTQVAYECRKKES